MRILLINHFPLAGSGSGVYVKNIAERLCKIGHEVCVIFPENTSNIKKNDGVKIHPVFFKKDEKIEGQLNFNFPCMDIHPRSSFLFENMTKEQINQYENAFKNAIEEEIIKFKPDLIHSQHIWIISGLLKDYNIPYIITSHGAEFITYKKVNTFDKYGIDAIEGCGKLIAISNDNMEEIIEKFPNAKDKMDFVKNGYNSREFFIDLDINKKEILNKYSINEDFDKIVLFVGRISKLKGLDVLLKAAKIYENDKTLTLIAGDGEYKEELKVMQEEMKLKNIVFLGSKEHSELRNLYNIADVLVLPSRKEALPLVAIESLACGTPAIVTNQSGMDQIINEDVGLIFEMDNDKMLAEKINLILNNKRVFDKHLIADYAQKHYSEEILINKLLDIYTEIKK